MSSLAALETDFLAHVRSGGLQPLAAGVCVEGALSTRVGLAIYANAYRARLRDALASDHPVLAAYLGDELWARCCAGYIDAHPSRQRSLRAFGEATPVYLAATAPFAAHALIAELAAFERQLLDVFDAADAARCAWSELLELAVDAWPRLRIVLHPTVRLLSTRTNVVAVWQALKAGAAAPPEAGESTTPAVLLWRDSERISRFRTLAPDEFRALGALVAGQDFAGLCDCLAQVHAAERVPALAIAFLQRWFDEELVSRFDQRAQASG